MLSDQGCLLIYTSVGNTWISLLSMLHNRFNRELSLVLYPVSRVYVHSANRRATGGGPALPPGEPSLAELPGSFSPQEPHGTVLWAVTGYLLFEQSNWGEMLP